MEIVEGYIVNKFGNKIKGDSWFWKEPVAEESIDTKVDMGEFTSEEQECVMSPPRYAMHRAADALVATYHGAKNALGSKNDVDKTVAAIREYAK